MNARVWWHTSCIAQRVPVRQRRNLWRGVCFALALPTFSWTATAHASPESDATARDLARALADQGADAYAGEDYAHAQLLFARAYGLVPAPTIALLEARALVKLGRWADAQQAYRRASEAQLAESSPAPFREAARTAAQELAELTPRIPRIRLRFAAEAATAQGLEVLLDGRRVPDRELRDFIHLDPGFHRIELRGRDVNTSAVEFTLEPGQTKIVKVDARSKQDREPKPTLAYVSFGVGAVGLATGVTAGVISLNARADAQRLCEAGTCEPDGRGREALERFRDFRAVSTVGYVLGVVGVGAGIGLLVFRDDTSRREIGLSATLDELRFGGTW